MNAEQTLEIISKTWCSIDDLMKLTGLSRSSSIRIKNNIKHQLEYEIHTTDLPMNIVVDYLKIDINYLKKIATGKEEMN